VAKIEGYEFPLDLYFHQEHSWVRLESPDRAVIGMNDFFQKAAGDIVHVDLPFEGDEVAQGETCGKIQSGKWIGKLVAPLSGEVIQVNEELEDNPTLINSEPYGRGWIAVLKPSSLDSELEVLMHSEEDVRTWLLGEFEKEKAYREKK